MELDIEGLKRYEPHPRYLKAMRESDDGQYFKCPDVLAVVESLRKQLEEATTAKEHVTKQAEIWHQEANTQKAIVIGILKALDLPLQDWTAESFVVGKFNDMRNQLKEKDAFMVKQELELFSLRSQLPTAIEYTIRACVMAIDQEGLKYGDKLMQAKEEIAKRVMDKLERKNG